ncbi:MAG: hydroxymethylglutaryl-CoA reductase [Anaerolineae bacterium]|nr:hydroxymethylglutaryl-CoA reductase [Anaerolineae bacterium]MCB0233471.1 hydroxymethylglutaryl-CoA reductase [Anaerolineae bacterium]MCB0248133.1 hydroxymethylglutaryl-CoA reductase [Anaerolineae bacterium]MCO5242637.1 hydroxymethylglutaryl-CoA reductase [Anaerolineae bacterium]
MALIPSMVLKQLYTFGSLRNSADGVRFSLKNRLSDATVTALNSVSFDGQQVPAGKLSLVLDTGEVLLPADLRARPIEFPLRKTLDIVADIEPLADGKHRIEVKFDAQPFGSLTLKVDGSIVKEEEKRIKIPRDNADNYSPQIIKARQQFIEEFTGKKLEHIPNYSFDPHITAGNIENFTGVAQVPIGFAGPLTINGEHAQGEFVVPMATAEGTLVASYNRGMKIMNLSGGVKVSVIGDAMQRAPVFVFDDARQARDFVVWVQANIDSIREEAEASSSVAKLQYVDPYLASKFAFLRFNYTTGDAAGQNMVGRATFAACSWIIDNYDVSPIRHFYLESNLATDKKASQVNVMHTRGKRVVAEATVKKDVLIQHMRVEPEGLFYHYNVANVGAILSGANNNGLHSANGITAMFIATGQDVANVSESSAAILYTELTPDGDLYMALTIPSLIVATYGGGTSLATQRECLELMGCYGRGTVNRFAEIVGAVALAGEISLASAISSSDWVSSHEKYGRNR